MTEIISYFPKYGMYLIYGIIVFLIIKHFINELLKNYHSNWSTYIDTFDYSPKEFYDQLKKELESHGIKNIKIQQKYIKEGGVTSYARMYLRVTWKEYQYDICGCKFGNAFFISWRLFYKNSLGKIIMSKVPFVGAWLAQQWYPVTYYRIDTASMFMSYSQSSVLKVIDDIANEKGVRVLTEAERKPVLNNIFNR